MYFNAFRLKKSIRMVRLITSLNVRANYVPCSHFLQKINKNSFLIMFFGGNDNMPICFRYFLTFKFNGVLFQ